ncbi:MFS transporter [Allokutzneria albata]|uniref:Predicted arabinose efflux permease, MFS family n=1 Tax=Allokutzneria albata TaxID=211114 RepID=A0A1G9UCD2_ALLAB|nr:MFS transporter [Allokutzneria albata]SDM57596.1 Predicted arabinose efflux permease, MFS family [Allokutzneria albata]
MSAPVSETKLSRNRNFHLLWTAQAGSELSNQVFVIACPLLVAAVWASPALAGVAGFVLSALQLLAGLPAGVLADRWDRRKILVFCALARACAYGGLCVAIWSGALFFPFLLAVAAVEGVALALAYPAEEAALSQVVPPSQLSSAFAMNSARGSLGQLGGNAFGAALLQLGRAFPFLLNAILQSLSFVALLFLRLPPREIPERRAFSAELAEGVRWVLGNAVLRIIAACAVLLNVSFVALYLVVLLAAQARGTPESEIGLLGVMLGVGGLLGALVAPRLLRRLSPYASIAGVIGSFVLIAPLLAFSSNVLEAGALLAVSALLAPTANTAVMTYLMLLTPDELRGRVGGALGLLDSAGGAFGSLVGGVLMELFGGRTALLLCAAFMVVPALLVAFSPVLRAFDHDVDTEASGSTRPR